MASPQPHIRLKYSIHRNVEVVQFFFDYHENLVKILRQLPGAQWSSSKKCWYQPREQFHLSHVLKAFKSQAWIDYSELKSSAASNKIEPLQNGFATVKSPVPAGYLEKLEHFIIGENLKISKRIFPTLPAQSMVI